MDKLERYRQFIRQILIEHGQIKPAYGEYSHRYLARCRTNRRVSLDTIWLEWQVEH
jgi:hypothetical protein